MTGDIYQFNDERLIKAFDLRPAKRVRHDLSFPCWEREPNSIMVSTPEGMMVWPILDGTL